MCVCVQVYVYVNATLREYAIAYNSICAALYVEHSARARAFFRLHARLRPRMGTLFFQASPPPSAPTPFGRAAAYTHILGCRVASHTQSAFAAWLMLKSIKFTRARARARSCVALGGGAVSARERELFLKTPQTGRLYTNRCWSRVHLKPPAPAPSRGCCAVVATSACFAPSHTEPLAPRAAMLSVCACVQSVCRSAGPAGPHGDADLTCADCHETGRLVMRTARAGTAAAAAGAHSAVRVLNLN